MPTTKSLVDEARYTVSELAEMFGVSNDNGYSKIHTGQLRAFRRRVARPPS